MSDSTGDGATRGEPLEDADRPVVTGLVALLAVGLVIGLVLGVATLIGTRVLGLGGDDGGTVTARETLFLPTPSPTEPDDGPLITLAPSDEPSSTSTATSEPSPTETESEKPERDIALSASQTAVAPMEQIDLTGVYPSGEGAILQVQRFEGGWEDFPVTVSVSGGTFATYVQTGRTGRQRFRVVDTDTGEASNEVRVQVG